MPTSLYGRDQPEDGDEEPKKLTASPTAGSMCNGAPGPSLFLSPGLFKDINDLRKAQPIKKRYSEVLQSSYYNYSNPIALIAASKRFEYFTLFVISLNAIWIGIDTDWNDAPDISSADIEFQVVENLFCVYFTFEVLVRFLAFKKKRDSLKDNWFKFDFVLVTFMIIETWIMPLLNTTGGGLSQLSILRLLRLLRLTRMVRLMRAVPELLTLIKGIIAATRSVGSTMMLLIIFTYVFAIVFTGVYRELEALPDDFDADEMCEDVSFLDQDPLSEQCRRDALIGCFGDMPKSFFTLLVNGTLLDDLTFVAYALLGDSQPMLWVMIVFILITCFTVFNMLVGVLCEVISATSAGERLSMATAQLQAKLREAFDTLDENQSGTVSRKEFEKMLQDQSVLDAMQEMSIEAQHLEQLGKVMFFGLEEDTGHVVEKELGFKEFMDTLMKLQPGEVASVLDIMDIREHFHAGVAEIHNKLKAVERAYIDLEVMNPPPCVYCGKYPNDYDVYGGNGQIIDPVENASSLELIQELAKRFVGDDANDFDPKKICKLLRPAADDDEV